MTAPSEASILTEEALAATKNILYMNAHFMSLQRESAAIQRHIEFVKAAAKRYCFNPGQALRAMETELIRREALSAEIVNYLKSYSLLQENTSSLLDRLNDATTVDIDFHTRFSTNSTILRVLEKPSLK